ncbi:uncharacterized protein LOC114523936 [Dendronephthya gigantea]|uniref:uncharacterized protein LOC114523936 n=1 Tax=Dendronephthya gigantea TaxID=151771 RepID=UPI00106D0991|nr:uncharacterized protein LOC114523936 [Dendronephthya gigantea]
MENNVLSIINEDFPDVMQTLEERIKRLQQRDYYILVAGETSSGKSCLINLLLGVELLPYSCLSTTSTICEIKYGIDPKLVAHGKGTSNDSESYPPLPPKTVRLKEPDVCDKSYKAQIAPYVHKKKDRGKGTSYEKVEIFWPNELLQVGVVIIDSPGVGESEIMDQTLMSYLPNAFAFIYVINSTNAGGIQKDRLVRILDKVRSLESSDEMNSNHLAECALFVANKWDQVDKDEQAEVKQHIVQELKQYWPDGNPLEQTVYVSTKEALDKRRQGKRSEEYDALIEGIKSMVLKAINSRLINHWAWMNLVLNRIIFRIEGFNQSMLENRDALIQRMSGIHGQITTLQNARQEDIAQLEKKFAAETEILVDALYEYLSCPEFKASFTSWYDDEIPGDEKTWILTKAMIVSALEKRFETFLANWEEANGVHAKVHDELVECFQTKFRLAEAEIKDIEEVIHTRQSQASSESTEKGERPEFDVTPKFINGKKSPLWITVGVASLIVTMPLHVVKKARQSISEKMRMDTYRKDRMAYLIKRSKKFLASRCANKDQVRVFVKEQMHLAEAMLQEYVSRIPRILEANRRMALELMNETRSKDEVWRANSPIFRKCKELQRMLSLFGILIWSGTVRAERLNWSEDEHCCIGLGEFSSVYTGILTKIDPGISEEGSPAIVAIKVFKQPLDSANANYFLKNEAKIRDLEHENICKFLGAFILKDPTSQAVEDIRIALVMTMYQHNLRSVIFSRNFTPPVNAIATKRSTIMQFLEWAMQIANALTYIHCLKLVHKHLTLENILVGPDGCVKVSDIGIIGRNEPTQYNMIYTAPEVLQSNSYVYSAGSDVYSLGLVFWEMWHGSQVFSEILPLNKYNFMEKVISGYRPQKPGCKIRMPEVKDIIDQCLSGEIGMRITASRCYSYLVTAQEKLQTEEND